MKKDSVTITLTTNGFGSGNGTTEMSGIVHSAYVSISKAVGANSKITVTANSTKNVILVVANPSTLGSYYYPRNQIHGSTGNLIGSTAGRTGAALFQENFKVNVSSSSGLSGETAQVDLFID